MNSWMQLQCQAPPPRPARRKCRATASCNVDDRLHTFAAHKPACINQAGLDILRREIRIRAENSGRRISGGEHAKHVLHS